MGKGKYVAGKIVGFFIRTLLFAAAFSGVLYVFPGIAAAMDKTACAVGTLLGGRTEISVFSEFADISGAAINKALYLIELAKDNIEGKYEQKREINSIMFTCAAEFPCDGGNITSGFGKRINPISKRQEVHTGIDIAAAEGSNIYAAWPGRVAEIGTDEIYGNYIVIKHSNSLLTRYCHLSEISVKMGDRVEARMKIGEAGSTGQSTGSHLHFEVIACGSAVDPQNCLSI